MAFPVVIYNASSGSDTAASGAGPGTAVTGTAAAHTGGSASTTITLTNTPDLSGVATDGSAVLFLATTSGTRHLSKITAVNDGADTVTVEDSFNIASGSAVNYAIGGKRQTLQADTSRRDTADLKAGWTFEFEAGTYDIGAQLSPAAGDATSGRVTFRAASGASPTLRTTANVKHFNFATFQSYIGLTITTNSGTKTSTAMGDASPTANGVLIKNCTIDGLQRGYDNSSSSIYGAIIGCEIKNCVGAGIYDNGPSKLTIAGCYIHDNGANGCHFPITSGEYFITRCIFDTNTGDGINTANAAAASPPMTIFNCTFYGNTGDGIDLSGMTLSTNCDFTIRNNIFSQNGNYGIRGVSNNDFAMMDYDYNAFYSNTSGALLNVTAGSHDVTLSGDPFTNAASGDFSLNNTAGAGAACRAVGFPGAFPGATTTGYLDIGAVQHADPAGGGGLLTHPGMSGGMRG